MREDGKGNSKEEAGDLRRSRQMSFYQQSPAVSQSLSSVLPKLPMQLDGTEDSEEERLGNVENFVPHLSSNSRLTTKTKPPNAWNQKKRYSCVRCTAELSKNENIAVFFLVYWAD